MVVNKKRALSVFASLVATFLLLRIYLHLSSHTTSRLTRITPPFVHGSDLGYVRGASTAIFDGGSKLLDLATVGFISSTDFFPGRCYYGRTSLRL